MKTLFAVVWSALVLLMTGCGTVGSDFKASMHEKFVGPTYHTRVISGEARAVYEAARQSIDKIGFHFVGGGPAQGRIDALSGLSANDSLLGARQFSMKVKLSPAATGTEVAVLITEQVQEDSSRGTGQATETPLRESALYEAFFREIGQSLTTK